MNFRKVPTRSFQGIFYSLAGLFLINDSGLHWFLLSLNNNKAIRAPKSG